MQTARSFRCVRDIDRVKKLANGSKGRFGVGGMISKLEAVKMAVDAGITTVIINGRRPDLIPAVVAGERPAPAFSPVATTPAHEHSLGESAVVHSPDFDSHPSNRKTKLNSRGLEDSDP